MAIKFKAVLDDDIRRTLNAFTRLQKQTDDKNVNSALRKATKTITQGLADEIVKAAYVHPFYPAQAAKVATTVKVLSDRVPKIGIGKGRGRIFSGGARAGDVLFGSEFGSTADGVGSVNFKTGKRFPPRSSKSGRGNAGYWIFPTIKANERFIRDEWLKMSDELFAEFRKK
jgi:hypothetical protein